MKNLVYKDFRITFHPLLLIFVVGLTALAAIPNYPKFIGYFYAFACYPIIFIGVNKGQNSNDVFYSLTLPVKRSDVVKSRLISLTILHIALFLMTTIYFIIGTFIEKGIPADQIIPVGFANSAYLTMSGFSFICLGLLNLAFLPLFYRDAKSITAAMIVSMFVFMIPLICLNLLLPLGFPEVGKFFNEGGIGVNIITFVICLIIYFGLNTISYIFANKNFEKVDF